MPQAATSTDMFEAIIAGLESAGLSRSEICRQTGLSQATIWRAANRAMRAPAFHTYERLAQLAEKVGVLDSRHVRHR